MFKYLLLAGIIYFIYKSFPNKHIESADNKNSEEFSDYEEID